MSGIHYVIQRGDTLSSIAKKHLGSADQWRVLFEHNRRPEVVHWSGSTIADPDVIAVGQTIYIPNMTLPQPGNVHHLRPKDDPLRDLKITPMTGTTAAYEKMQSVPMEIQLDYLPKLLLLSPGFEATIGFSGKIMMHNDRSVDWITLTSKGFEVQAKTRTDLAFSELLRTSTLGFDQSTGMVTLSCGITTQAKPPGSLKTRLEMSMDARGPVWKGSIIAPELRGQLGHQAYLTKDLQFNIEIRQSRDRRKLAPEKVPVSVAHRRQARSMKHEHIFTNSGLPEVQVENVVQPLLLMGALMALASAPISVPVTVGVLSVVMVSQMLEPRMTRTHRVHGGPGLKVPGLGVTSI